MLGHYVETLTLLADETRLRLCALLRDRELRVTDLVRVTGIAQSRVSTHLGRLREAGYVQDRRDGPQSFYALSLDRAPEAVRALLEEATSSADPTLAGDQTRLRELEAERRGEPSDPLLDDFERDYSPGRSWHSLSVGLAACLDLGDVLDVGSGDGSAAACLAPHCRSLRCVDANPRMVAAASERLQRFSHVRVEVADVHALPFEDAAFSTVLLFHTLTYAEHPAVALAECARVLRRGGRIVLLCLDEHDQQHVTRRYHERHAGFAPESVRKLLVGAGFEVLEASVACRESRKPQLQVILAVGEKGRAASPDSLRVTSHSKGKSRAATSARVLGSKSKNRKK